LLSIFAFSPSFYKRRMAVLWSYAFRYGCCSALVRRLIFDIADVRLKWRQPTQVDQSVVPGAVDIAGGVFAATAGNNLEDQLEIFILRGAP
jgi:hypothetical protein